MLKEKIRQSFSFLMEKLKELEQQSIDINCYPYALYEKLTKQFISVNKIENE